MRSEMLALRPLPVRRGRAQMGGREARQRGQWQICLNSFVN